MASRIARSALLGATRASRTSTTLSRRQILHASTTATSETKLDPPSTSSMPSGTSSSSSSTNLPSNDVDPKKKAQSLLDSLPGSSIASKTAYLSAGAGLSIAAISNELYVVNDETIVLVSLLTVYWALAHYTGPMYSEWAEGQIEKMKKIFRAAREDHTSAVQSRIENVKGMESVVEATKGLFAVSKETARLEAQAYELEQKTAVAAEAKAVLDSWVRYEGQVKQKQQKELAESIITKINKELDDPKVLRQILDQSVKDVERIVASAKA